MDETTSGDHQRPPTDGPPRPRIDPDTAGELALGLPWVFWSFLVMAAVVDAIADADTFGWWVGAALWVASGAVAWWPGAEDLAARWWYRLRRPHERERALLDGPWQAVTQAAGVDPARYTLWVHDDGDVTTARPPAGGVVAVTSWALHTPPPALLPGILAHELSHSLAGRDRLSLLLLWYSLPARAVGRAAVWIWPRLRKIPYLGCLATGFIAAVIFGMVLTAWMGDNEAVLALLAIASPVLTPPAMAWGVRVAEKRADLAAVKFGYGRQLTETLYGWQTQRSRNPSTAAGRSPVADRITALVACRV